MSHEDFEFFAVHIFGGKLLYIVHVRARYLDRDQKVSYDIVSKISPIRDQICRNNLNKWWS